MELEAWLREVVAQRFAGAGVGAIEALKGDASSRRFWRVAIAGGGGERDRATPATAVAIDLGPDDLPLYARALNLIPEPLAEPPWLSLQRFLAAAGVAVPELYADDAPARRLLVEDVGEIPLFEAALRGDAGDLYRLAADQLLAIHLEGTRRLESGFIAARVAYDARLFRWELSQFVDYGVAEVSPAAAPGAIAPELDDLAARLGGFPRVLSHRDYHGNNLFLQATPQNTWKLRVIDFQDALMAPAAQDLAVLLTTRAAARVITPTLERRMLEYYFAAHLRRGTPMALTLDEFLESYRLCVMQHALKVIGRFIWLERNGKSGYAAYIPYALDQARRVLADRHDFPQLRAALGA
ncbi:MAG TPA: phosphotransferase [Candidatus Binataceae bacterium]|nr:phosphotransferase [Candidatus Binataceae bacterium]